MQDTPNPEEIQLDLSAKGIWQKLPGESASSYAAFTLYLKLGNDATLKQVADKIGRSPAAVGMLSSRYHWQERAQAWRIHLANLAFAGLQRQTIENRELSALRNSLAREQAWRRSQKIAEVVDRGLDKMLANPDTEVAHYALASLVRCGHNSAQKATAPVLKDEESHGFDDAAQSEADLDKILGEEPKPDTTETTLPKPPEPPTSPEQQAPPAS